ncbi:MAG: VCBS repeat-containing protein [Acidobacteriota bacterium]
MAGLATLLPALVPGLVPEAQAEKPPGEEVTAIPIREQLRHAFSAVQPHQVPSGILLEVGAVLDREAIRKWGVGSVDDAMDPERYRQALSSLEASRLSQEDGPMIQLDAMRRRTQDLRELEAMTPLSLAIIDYQSATEEEIALAERDEEGRLHFETREIGEPARFAAMSLMADRVYGPDPQLILPSDLVVTNVPEVSPHDLQISLRYSGGESWREVIVDEPFIANGIVADSEGFAHFDFKVSGGGASYEFGGRARLIFSAVQGESCDINFVTDPITGASVNIRIIPNPGSIETDGTRCVPRLRQPLIAVDGFDVKNDRTLDEVWGEFGTSLEAFGRLGYDLILVDYRDGRDFIGNNANAIRELLVRRLPNYMEPGFEHVEAALIGGSMGSQTSLWALRDAELMGLDHNVGLFVAIDGPFMGATIPVGLMALVEFLAPLSNQAEEMLDGLNSPAARQMLLKNRRYRPNLASMDWYKPDFLHLDYYSRVEGRGLPQTTRNVAVSNGSGSGHIQNDSRLGARERIVDISTLGGAFLAGSLDATAWTDNDGLVFKGSVRAFFLRKRWSLDFQPSAEGLDLASGGSRPNGPQTVSELEGGIKGLFLNAESDSPNQNFIPTHSSLWVDDRLTYQPSVDPLVFDRSPFDALFWENCNSGHATPTGGNIAFISSELIAFRDGLTPPPQTRPFGQPCGVTSYRYWGHVDANVTHGRLGSWFLNSDDKHLSGDFDGDGRAEVFHARPASRWMQIGEYPGSSGTPWTTIANNGNHLGRLDGDGPNWTLQNSDRFFSGDFDGDAVDEILAFNAADARARLVEKSGGELARLWDSRSDVPGKIGSWFINPGDKVLVGDFDSNGRDELLLIGRNGFAHLIRYTGTTWSLVWGNNPSIAPNIGSWTLRQADRFYVGDFNSDGRDELLSVNPWNGWIDTQNFQGGTWFGRPNGNNRGNGRIGGLDVSLFLNHERVAIGDFDASRVGEELLFVNNFTGESSTLRHDPTLGWRLIAGNGASRRWALWSIAIGDHYLPGDFTNRGRDEVLMLSPLGAARLSEFP